MKTVELMVQTAIPVAIAFFAGRFIGQTNTESKLVKDACEQAERAIKLSHEFLDQRNSLNVKYQSLKRHIKWIHGKGKQ